MLNITTFLNRKTESSVKGSLTKRQKAVLIISAVLFILGSAALTGTIWGKGTFGDLAPDQMLINMFSPREGTSEDIMTTLWSGPVLQTAIMAVLFVCICLPFPIRALRSKFKSAKVFSHKSQTVLCLVLSLCMFTGGVSYGVVQFELTKIFKMCAVNSSFIENNFADPHIVKMLFPEKKRNLIFIYLESMENTYISEDLGGYMSENLIKPLTDLAKEGYSFSHLPEGFGGAVSATGCVWSVAAMVNMNCGIPMKITAEDNNYSEAGRFLPGAVSIGDILETQGYEQTLMLGSTARFGGLNHFYEGHGGFKIMDYDYAKANGMIPQNYNVWWGFEDKKLYEFAKEEITRLYETGKPFNFVMETADTHFPDGYADEAVPRTRESQYADVIAYSAGETVKFVRWIQKQPFYDNTTVVLIGDHNSMDAKFFDNFDKSYIRTTFNLILNPAESVGKIPKERMQNRWFYNCDMFPTVLAGIGVKIEGDRLALGTNLFSETPTLFEEYGGKEGWKSVSSQFEFMSPYYNRYISNSENKPFDTKNISYY